MNKRPNYFLISQQIQSSMATSQMQANSPIPNQSPNQSPRKKESKSPQQSMQASKLAIPLITKRMNFVQRYIKDFADKDSSNRLRKSNNYFTERVSPDESLSPADDPSFSSPMCSVDIGSMNFTEPKPTQKSCIKYSTIRDQRSEDRIQSLGKLEVQYLRLKERAHLPSFLPTIAARKQVDPAATISHEEVERQIKKSIITQGGQRYFADLYLMKKGRDKIITSLSSVGKHTLTNTHESYDELIRNSLAYEDQVAASKQEFVKKKILEDRHNKKGKMLRGRNMNWNVYYDIMALPANERKKLKGIQKFEADYGIL